MHTHTQRALAAAALGLLTACQPSAGSDETGAPAGTGGAPANIATGGAPATPDAAGGTGGPGAGGTTVSNGGTTAAGANTGGAGGGATPDATPSAPDDGSWWDKAFRKRARITVSDPDLKEELTDFQVPVQVSAGALAGANAGGADLRFVSAAGTRLDHEIEVFDPAGTSFIWLRLPKHGAQPTQLWLYYDNPTATAPTDAEAHGVWPAPYTGVWHLGGNGKDASPNGHDGTEMVGGSFAAGKLGKGLLLDGGKREHIRLKPDIKLVAGAPGCTFSAWINPTKIENSVNGMIIMTVGKWFNNNHNSYTDFNINAAGQLISHIDPGPNVAASGYARILSDAGFVKTNEWAFVTYVIDLPAKEERFFKNGQLVSTKPPPAGKAWANAFIDMVSTRVVIGAEEDIVSHFYTGSMDELRIEKGMRSAAWIAAQYRAMTVPGYVKVEAEAAP